MILTKDEIEAAGIVEGAVDSSCRSTTYDATVGEFLSEGVFFEGNRYVLEKRSIVWVVSREVFTLGEIHTGLATLKTQWTHKGVLALNVGVIDPGWSGPLATALVNFSGKRITIQRGDPFFRVIIFQHKQTGAEPNVHEKFAYLADIRDKSRHFSATFLNTHSLVDEVAQSIFKLPKIGIWIALAALLVTILSIFAPIAFQVWNDQKSAGANIKVLEQRVESLERNR